MKRILIIFLIIFSIMQVSYPQTYVKTDFFSYTKQFVQENLPYVMARTNEVEVNNGVEQFYIVYYETFFRQLIAGQWTIFFLKKEYNGVDNDTLFEDNGFPAREYVNDLLIHNLPKLLKEFDVYVCQLREKDLKPFEEGNERGEIVTVYYPKDPATYYIYKYTPQGWLQIDKSIGSGNTRIVGYYYLKPLALLKIYKYKWNEWLTYKYSQAQIAQANEVISLIEALSVNIYDGNEEGYQRNYTLLKQKLENNEKLRRDSSLLRLAWSVHGVDLIETPVPLKDRKLYSQTRAAINTLFALGAYEFSNDKWSKIYRLFQWYNPQTKNPEFNKATDVLVKQLQKFRDLVKP